MSRDTKEIAIGGLALAGVVLVLAFLYSGGDLSARAAGRDYAVTAVFNQIDGLFEGDEVRLGGIRVGTVEGQALDRNYRAAVTLRIDGSVKLPTDTSAAIHTDGLFGAKYVVLEPGGDEEFLSDGDSISMTQGAIVVSELLELIISQGKARLRKESEGKPSGGGK